MKKLINETMEFLREKVENLEREILLLTDGGTARCVSDDKGAYLVKLIEERKEDGWMFSYIGADHDVESVASSISITNTVTWTKTVEGTEEVFCCENQARTRFFNKVASCMKDGSKSMKTHLKNFSSEYYEEDL